MPIQHISQLEVVQASASPDEAEQIAQKIVMGLGTNIRDFQHASQTYNSVYFKNVEGIVVRAACSALKAHFSQFSNSYWNKASGV